MSLRERLEAELSRLEAEGLLRAPPVDVDVARGLVDICTNDYLGYASRSVSRETTSHGGAGASRLIRGTRPSHLALEAELADWVGAEDALLFSSGYAANLGVMTSLAEEGDCVVSDRLNHASIIDGCRLSKAEVHVVPHRDLGAVASALRRPARGRRWVVTESYFSMEGDSPDLLGLRALCDAADAALIVDEAHALGVFGEEGSGLCRAAGVVPDVLVGTLGKAVGVQGAFVAGTRQLTRFLWNRARSFVFSTATSPALAAHTLDNVRAIRRDDAARARLDALCRQLEAALGQLPKPPSPGRHGPIFPILLGTPERALQAAADLRERGFLAQPIRPPTVPHGTSRVRVALHSRLGEAELSSLADVLRSLCSES